MKLSKTAWWILGIGFFVLASVVMVMLYVGQSGDVDQLEESLWVNQSLLIKLTADSEELNNQLLQLEDQLDEAKATYNQSKANFVEAVMSIEYDEELFSMADDVDLEVTSLIASESLENEVEGIPFGNTVFEVAVRGTVSNILTFISDITTGGYFDSATVEQINMEVPEAGEIGQPSAIITIIIYSYEGE